MPDRAILDFYIREKGVALMAGEVIEGHSHNFDHVSEIPHGRLRAWEREKGKKKWRLHTESGSSDGIYAANYMLGYFPEIAIRAGLEHKFEILEDYTTVKCWHHHRDHEGRVVPRYLGNLRATQ